MADLVEDGVEAAASGANLIGAGISGIVGILMGFLAGRSSSTASQAKDAAPAGPNRASNADRTAWDTQVEAGTTGGTLRIAAEKLRSFPGAGSGITTAGYTSVHELTGAV